MKQSSNDFKTALAERLRPSAYAQVTFDTDCDSSFVGDSLVLRYEEDETISSVELLGSVYHPSAENVLSLTFDENVPIRFAITKDNDTYTLSSSVTMRSVSVNIGAVISRCWLSAVADGVLKIWVNELASLSESDDTDPLSRRLPKRDCSFTMYDLYDRYLPLSDDGLYNYLNTNMSFKVYQGLELTDESIEGEILTQMEWLPADRYYLNSKPSTNGFKVSFTGIGLFQTMNSEETFIKSEVLMSTPMGTQVNAVISDMGYVSSIPDLYNDYTLDTAIPVDTHLNLLQNFARIMCSKLSADESNVITLTPVSNMLSGEVVARIGYDEIMQNGYVGSKSEKLKTLTINRYPCVNGVQGGLTFSVTYTINTQSAYVDFGYSLSDVNIVAYNDNNESVEISTTIYKRGADISTDYVGTYRVQITGILDLIGETTDVYTFNSDGQDNKISCWLVNNESVSQYLADTTKTYFSYRTNYDLTYRGRPDLEVGDIIEVPYPYNPYQETRTYARAMILTTSLSFSAGWSGRLKVKILEAEPGDNITTTLGTTNGYIRNKNTASLDFNDKDSIASALVDNERIEALQGLINAETQRAEDSEDSLDERLSDLNTTVNSNSQSILNVQSSLDSMTLTFVKTEDLSSSVTDAIEKSQVATNVGEIYKYIKFVDGSIILAAEGENTYKLKLMNNVLFFYQGNDAVTDYETQAIAYFSTDGLVVKNLTATNTLAIGNFYWKPEDNGSLSLVYKK